jgi:hypothetical protein
VIPSPKRPLTLWAWIDPVIPYWWLLPLRPSSN